MSLNAAPEPAYETFEDGTATASRCSIKRCFSRRCACLLCVLVTGLVVGGGFGAVIALSMNQQAALPSPFLPRCGSCATGPLEGKFAAHVSEDTPIGGGVSYDVRHHEFRTVARRTIRPMTELASVCVLGSVERALGGALLLRARARA